MKKQALVLAVIATLTIGLGAWLSQRPSNDKFEAVLMFDDLKKFANQVNSVEIKNAQGVLYSIKKTDERWLANFELELPAYPISHALLAFFFYLFLLLFFFSSLFLSLSISIPSFLSPSSFSFSSPTLSSLPSSLLLLLRFFLLRFFLPFFFSRIFFLLPSSLFHVSLLPLHTRSQQQHINR